MLAIIVSIGAAIFGIFGGDQSALLAGIATTLGILAFGIIRDRYGRDALLKAVERLEKSFDTLIQKTITADGFFHTRATLPPFSERLNGARTVDVMGASLIGLSTTYKATLRNLKDSGATIRLLGSNPDNASLQQYLANRLLEAETPSIHADMVRTTLKSVAPIAGDSPTGGSLCIRITNQVQPFSYIGINTSTSKGRLQVELYLSKISLERNPIFTLDSATDPHWYNEFKDQFEFFWEQANEYTL